MTTIFTNGRIIRTLIFLFLFSAGFTGLFAADPVATADNFSVDEGGTYSEPATGVLGNDTGDNPITADLVTDVSHGVLSLNTDGSFSYTHDGTENYTDEFEYRAYDATLDAYSNTVAVSITITPVNDPPTLTTISTLTGATEDTPYTITYAALAAAANEADAEGDAISFRVEAVSTGTLQKGGVNVTPGTTLLSSGESFVWTPATNANGTLNAFTVKAYDLAGNIIEELILKKKQIGSVIK